MAQATPPSSPTLALHAPEWPRVVGVNSVSCQQILDAICSAKVDDVGFDGIDFLVGDNAGGDPIAIGLDMSDAQVQTLSGYLSANAKRMGALVSPSWGPDRVPFGDAGQRDLFVKRFKATCELGNRFADLGLRRSDIIRIDSGTQCDSPLAQDPGAFGRLVLTMQQCAEIARDHGQRVAFEPEAPWTFMNTLPAVTRLLDAVGHPEHCGVQVDLAHFVHLIAGTADSSTRLVPENWKWTGPDDPSGLAAWTQARDEAWAQCRRAVGNRLFDLHICQSDATVYGDGTHPATGRHCAPDDLRGVLDVVPLACQWLTNDGTPHGLLKTVTWDGCMIGTDETRPKILQSTDFWTNVLKLMIKVRNASGYAVAA